MFIDPVDPSRNAAAAVSLTSMSTFILASRRFLKRPSISYFTPSTKSALMLNTVEVVFTYPQEPPEVVWGRFKKRGRSLYKWLRECGFKVYRWGVESDDKTYVALVYVVESVELPPYILHRGPPVYDDAVDVFVEKYLGEDVVGPFVQGSRVYIIKRRKYTHISECIEKHLGRRLSNRTKQVPRSAGTEKFLDYIISLVRPTKFSATVSSTRLLLLFVVPLITSYNI